MQWRVVAMVTAVASVVAVAAMAQSAPVAVDDKRTDAERHQDRAEALRRAAQDRAASQLGYPSLRTPLPPALAVDYWALAQQIARLGAAIQSMAGAGAMPAVPPVVGGLGMMPTEAGEGLDPVASVYGPDGPTVKAVSLLLEYRLLVAGNPRLRIGKVSDEPGRIVAQVVTRDGSVVEEFVVDKKSGNWTPVR